MGVSSLWRCGCKLRLLATGCGGETAVTLRGPEGEVIGKEGEEGREGGGGC